MHCRGVRFIQAGAAELALPGRRRSGPLGGQEATRSEQPWGLHFPLGQKLLRRERVIAFKRLMNPGVGGQQFHEIVWLKR